LANKRKALQGVGTLDKEPRAISNSSRSPH